MTHETLAEELEGDCILPLMHDGPCRPAPAKPSEPCSHGVCSANNGHGGTCAEASGWAEPAEEETKAVTFDEIAQSLKRIGDAESSFGFNLRFWRRIAEKLIAKYPHLASSPVIPAPTETEWESCGHVPIGIVFRSKDRHPAFTWVNEGGSLLSVRNECEDGHFSDGEHCLPSMVDENFAPFVAAEEG